MTKEDEHHMTATAGMQAAAQERLEAVLSAAPKRRTPSHKHLMLKARTITATDRGDFTAVVSSETVDREQDVVLPQAMVTALTAWTKVNKLVPLLWNHGSSAAGVIGHVKPESATAVNGEVIIEGWVDQSTTLGEQSWRVASPAPPASALVIWPSMR